MKKLSLLVLAFALIMSACTSSADSKENEEDQKGTPNPENVVLIDMDVEGMTCTGCENTIKSGISELDGVMEVEASHLNAKTYVKVDTSLTSFEDIKDKISSKGYHVESSSMGKGEMPHNDGSSH